jgi:hypothetical protein
MTLGYSPPSPKDSPRPWTTIEKIAAVVIAVVLIVGALTLIP